MLTTFQRALAFVLKSEGGNDDDPDDHGGRTSRGITQREYDAWCTINNIPHRDVWTASQDHINTIYLEEYWQPWCDLLPIGTDYMFFDMSVNAGPHEAILLLQRALSVVDDGRIGSVTRVAIKEASQDLLALIKRYTAEKDAFYRACHQPKYLKGWLNRNKQVYVNALNMIQGK